MTYSTIAGTKRKIQQDLYSDATIDAIITATDVDVVPIINAALDGRTTDFTELELTTTAKDVRVASDCYCAYRVMSEHLEGMGYDVRALADVRFKETWEILRVYCRNNGITPSFDPDPNAFGDNVEFAYAVGNDTTCIG